MSGWCSIPAIMNSVELYLLQGFLYCEKLLEVLSLMLVCE